jgi:hypothetical protein
MTVAARIDLLHGVPGDGCDRVFEHYGWLIHVRKLAEQLKSGG